MRIILTYGCFLAFLMAMALPARSQDKDVIITRGVVFEGDTIPYIELRDFYVFEPLTFKNNRERRVYTRLVRNVMKVYPYAKLAAEKLNFYEDSLQKVSDPTERKRLMREVEKEIRDEFEDELKGLTITQGTILIKLIDRETGQTSYQILNDLRGRLIAGFWQSLGRLFGYNLKKKYDPSGDDWQIEYIVKQIEAGAI